MGGTHAPARADRARFSDRRFLEVWINVGGLLDRSSCYWSLAVDLSDTTHLVQDNSEAVPGNHWRLYRVPLTDVIAFGGITEWTAIKSARIWVDGLPVGAGTIMIGSMDVTGD